MEFKGTPGKWYLQEYTDVYTNIVRSDYGEMQGVWIVNVHGSGKCSRYDALLISKAPEMLEILNRLQSYFSTRACDSQMEEYLEQIESLIKESIELNESKVF